MNSTYKRKKTATKIFRNGFMMLIMIFYLFPLWYVFNNAFKVRAAIHTQPFILTPDTFTLESITTAFTGMNYLQSFYNSVITLLLSCLLFVLLGSMTAYGICIGNRKIFDKLYIFFVALIALPFQVAMVPLVSLLRTLHLSDTYMGLALIYTAMFMPFIVFVYTGFMRSIPGEVLESARIDGCSYYRAYLYIYMPLLKTVTGIVLILRGVFVWNDLQVPLVILNDPSMLTLQMRLFVFATSRVGNIDLVFASTLITCIPIVILFLFLQKTFVKGVMAGSIKG